MNRGWIRIIGDFCWVMLLMIPIGRAAEPDATGMKPYLVKFEGTKISFEMLPIPAGEFLMGSPPGESGRRIDEGPQVKVKIDPFWMGKCEVTWDEYDLWGYDLEIKLRLHGNHTTNALDAEADAVSRPTAPYTDMSFEMGREGGYPAVNMTQHAAKMYCEWLSKRTGHYYRLPTEAEWEYACRAGTTTSYSFGDNPLKLQEYAWCLENSGPNDLRGRDEDERKYRKVGRKKPNPWGLHDMHGNVSEWCLDHYTPNFHQTLKAKEPANWPYQIPGKEFPRVVRGGGFDDDPTKLRSASRKHSTPDWKMNDPHSPNSIWYMTNALSVGFRVIRPLKLPTNEAITLLKLGPILPDDAEENGRKANRREQLKGHYEIFRKENSTERPKIPPY